VSPLPDAILEAARARGARARGALFALAALTPAGWLLGFALLVLKARLATGRWPVPYEPDPGSIGGLLYAIVLGLLPLVYFLGMGGLLGLGVALSIRPLRTALRDAGLEGWHVWGALLGLVTIAVLVHADPWQLFTWLGD
jgi:hypothetical protein